MTAVSDSSPLIFFSKIGRLDLIQSLYEEVLVPPAVWRELGTNGEDRPGSLEVASADWIRRQPVLSAIAPLRLEELDPGEREAIMLAASLDSPVPLLLDDGPARRTAREIGLYVIGSAGIVGRANELGLIALVRPLLSELRDAGLYLGNSAERRLLDQSGEA